MVYSDIMGFTHVVGILLIYLNLEGLTSIMVLKFIKKFKNNVLVIWACLHN